MNASTVVLFLSLFLGLQPITTDLYLPALPAITEGFGASMSQAQLTMTALLLSFGFSQLVWGPLSDKYGRRPVLLWGVTAYTLASLACVFVDSMAQLIFWRAVQGAAMGSPVMCARAMTRDLYAPFEGTRAMSKGLTGLGIIAFLIPALGGWLTDVAGWRSAMAASSVFGCLCLAFIAMRFKETLQQRNPHALNPRTLLATWSLILRHPTFWTYSVLVATAYGGLFTILFTSSFVFIKALGVSKTRYGIIMALSSLFYVAGTFWCRWLLARYSVQRSVWIGAFVTLASGVLMVVLHLVQIDSPWAVALPFYFFMFGHGVHQPCGQAGSSGPFPQAAGMAAALAGFFMMVVAFINGAWLGWVMDGSVRPLVYGLAGWSVVIALVAWTLVQRYGQQSPH